MLKELYFYALMSETFMVGDYLQECLNSLDHHDFCGCYHFAFSTGIRICGWPLSLQQIAKTFNIFSLHQYN